MEGRCVPEQVCPGFATKLAEKRFLRGLAINAGAALDRYELCLPLYTAWTHQACERTERMGPHQRDTNTTHTEHQERRPEQSPPGPERHTTTNTAKIKSHFGDDSSPCLGSRLKKNSNFEAKSPRVEAKPGHTMLRDTLALHLRALDGERVP